MLMVQLNSFVFTKILISTIKINIFALSESEVLYFTLGHPIMLFL